MYIAPSVALLPSKELGLVCDRCSYKHSAPPELTRLVAALPRCESSVSLWLPILETLHHRDTENHRDSLRDESLK